MRLTFNEAYPYLDLDLSGQERPLLPVTLYGPRGKSIETYALLDSGADISMFHPKWAQAIGLDWKSGVPDEADSVKVGASTKGYRHTIDMRVGANLVTLSRIIFTDDISEEIDSQIIGRSVVFDSMRFAIREYRQTVYVGSTP